MDHKSAICFASDNNQRIITIITMQIFTFSSIFLFPVSNANRSRVNCAWVQHNSSVHYRYTQILSNPFIIIIRHTDYDLNYINLNGEISPNRRVLSRLVALNWKVPHYSHVRIPFSRFQNSFSLSLHCRMNCQILICLLLPKIQNHTTQITGNIGQESVEIIDVGSQGLVASDGSLNEIPSPRLINNWFL